MYVVVGCSSTHNKLGSVLSLFIIIIPLTLLINEIQFNGLISSVECKVDITSITFANY